MDGAVAGQVDVVGDVAVAAEQGAVGEDAAAADHAIVGDVAVDHEEVVAADVGRPRVGRAAVDGDVLAKDVVVADLDGCRLVVILEVLRAFAEDGAGIDDVAAAHGQGAAKGGVGAEDAVRPDGYGAFDDDVRSDDDAFAESCFRRNHRAGMDSRGLRAGHNRPPFLRDCETRRSQASADKEPDCAKPPMPSLPEVPSITRGMYTSRRRAMPEQFPEEKLAAGSLQRAVMQDEEKLAAGSRQ